MTKLLEKDKLRRVFTYLLFASAVVIAGFVLIREGNKVPWQTFHLNIILLILSLVTSAIGVFPALLAWRKILGLYHVHTSFVDDLHNFAFSMLGYMLPGGIWQVVGRSMLYQKQDISVLRITTASILETIIVGIAGWFLYWIGLVVQPDLSFIKWWGFQYIVLIPILIFLEPHVISKLSGWVIQKRQPNIVFSPIQISLKSILYLLFTEMLTLLIGGLAIFILLNSVFMVSPEQLIPVIMAYGFSISVSNIFFWLPGSMILKDGAMTIVLAQSLSLELAIVFVVLIRIWTILTVLIPVGLTWVFLDFFKLGRPKASEI